MNKFCTEHYKHHAFVLFACCIPVRGARRSVICDLQRQTYRFIPNGLHEILTVHRGKTIDEIKNAYNHEFDEEIESYFYFLTDEEFGFWSDEPENFPDLDLAWQRPERITNAIIDIDNSSDHNYTMILKELDDLGCKAIELRFFSSVTMAKLERVLIETMFGRLRSISLIAGWSEELNPANIEQLIEKHPRIHTIIIHSAPKPLLKVLRLGTTLIHRKEAIDSPSCCGQVHAGYFVTNTDLFTEAKHHNTCLNRKVSIDARGEVKNCPSMSRSFGNVQDVSLHSAIAQRDFTELWSINKDQIETCKDCEFRYICTDCRAYLTDSKNLYSKPAKCTYNPYTAEWAEQE